jgi:hypothetical protein
MLFSGEKAAAFLKRAPLSLRPAKSMLQFLHRARSQSFAVRPVHEASINHCVQVQDAGPRLVVYPPFIEKRVDHAILSFIGSEARFLRF